LTGLVYRNALSALLLLLALAGIVVELRLISQGVATTQAWLTLGGYIVIALYAGIRLYMRLVAKR